jgi:hypothetical protein
MSDKLKNILIMVLSLIIIIGGYFYYTTWHNAKQKIAKAQSQQAALIGEKGQLTERVAALSAKQQSLEQEIVGHTQSINAYQLEIKGIQDKLEQANKKTIAEYDDQSIAQSFKETYQLDEKSIQIIQIPIAGSPWKERVMTLPIDYVKLTVTAHDSKVACQQQSEFKTKIIDLNHQIDALQAQNLKLEKDKSMAYSQGYEQAFTMYIEVNKLYIDLLKSPPKVDLAPSWLQVTLGAIGGALICTL